MLLQRSHDYLASDIMKEYTDDCILTFNRITVIDSPALFLNIFSHRRFYRRKKKKFHFSKKKKKKYIFKTFCKGVNV